MSEKAFQNQPQPQKFPLKDKYLGSSTCKILGSILEMNKRRAQTNEPKLMTMHKALRLIDDVDSVFFKKRMRKRACRH